LVEHGPADRVLTRPVQDYTAGLLENSLVRRLPHGRAIQDGTPLLEVRQLVREYRRSDGLFKRAAAFRAVDQVSLTVQPGETVGLVGESGCGKSTLLRTVLGLDRAQGGEILLQGQAFDGRQTALRRIVQIVFQDPFGSFDPRWKVWQLVAEPLHLLTDRPTPAEARRRAERLLDKVGLSAADAERYPHQFSGGQRQRIAIARALITEPVLVVLDEAVSALDVSVRAQILALLAALSSELGVSYLFVSHDLSVVQAITDRVYVMSKGRIVETGITQQVFDAPRHAYTASLLAASPDLGRALARRALQS
jgi:peptide/nickel transport system ATP-binding protein